jgi:hypothetical protein
VNDGHLLVAYHGCDITVRDSLVTGRIVIRDIRNEYDWLGSGSYFYEGDPQAKPRRKVSVDGRYS